MAGGEASANKLDLAQRRQLAVALRKQGLSYREIADAIKTQLQNEEEVAAAAEGRKPKTVRYGKSTAHRDVTTILDDIEEETKEDARQLRRMNMLRYMDLLQSYWSEALGGYVDDEGNPVTKDQDAAKLVLRVLDQMERLYNLHKTVVSGDPDAPLQVNNPMAALSASQLDSVISNLEDIAGGDDG